MDDTGAAPQQRLVFGGQLPFGNKPVRSRPAADPEPARPDRDDQDDQDDQLALEDRLVLEAEERERAAEAAREPAPAVEVRPAPRPEPAIWDVARPAYLPPKPSVPAATGGKPAGLQPVHRDPVGADPGDPTLVEEPVDEQSVDVEPVDVEPVPDYPEPPRTGDQAVDEVLVAVAQAVHGPLEEQLAVFDTAHRTLQDRLADVEG